MKQVSVKRLLIMSTANKLQFVAACLALLVGSGVNLLFPQVMRWALEEHSSLYIVTHAYELGIVLMALFVVQGISFFMRTLLFGQIGHAVAHQARIDLYGELVNKPISFFDKTHSGDIVSCLVADTQLLQAAVSVRLSVLIRYVVQVLGGVVLMIWLSPLLSLLILLTLPLLVGVSMVLAGSLKRYSKLQQEKLGVASKVAKEMLSAMDIVKAFGAEPLQLQRFVVASQEVLALGYARTRVSAFFQSFVSFLLNVALLLLFLYAVSLVDQQYISMAELTAFLLYGAIVAVSFAFLMGSLSDLVQASAALQRVDDLLEVDRGIKNQASKGLAVDAGKEIVFKGVHFAYPTRAEVEVLRGVDFCIEPCRVTALIGSSGAGKTSIVELLLGLYELSTGSIRVGGIDLADCDWVQFRTQVGYVPQDCALFAVSISENLCLGNQDCPFSEVQQICEALNLHDFIMSLPDGYETNLGERGAQLSGGQRQRFAVARALLRKPKLLILDEATSALDTQNEADILRAISSLGRPVTVLLITHRASTLKIADSVLYLSEGMISPFPKGEKD